MLIFVDPQSYTNHYIKELAIDRLPEFCEVTSDYDRLAEVDIFVAGFGKVTNEMIEKAINLKVIIRNAVGTDNIDKRAADAHNIPVYNLPLVNYESVAEMVLGYMIACGRHIVFNHINNTKGIREDYYRNYQGIELKDKTFGIIGFGHIGRRVASIIKGSFSDDIVIYDPYVTDSQASEAGVKKVSDYKEILKTCDFITIHTPLTNETKNMINEETLKLCKKNCILINTARCGIVNQTALYNALKNYDIFAAADDVLEDEDEISPLYTLPNFIGTSHVCGNSQEARRRVGEHLYERLMTEINNICNK